MLVSQQTKSSDSKIYDSAFLDIRSMLQRRDSISFKNAVFITENAYSDNRLDKLAFDQAIKLNAAICRGIIASGNIEYPEKDKEKATAQCAVFVYMTDSISVATNNEAVIHTPFTYNFEDFAGQKDWSNMFVTTLMQTNNGNCHSMPYLYKMIMDELGQPVYLSLAP